MIASIQAEWLILAGTSFAVALAALTWLVTGPGNEDRAGLRIQTDTGPVWLFDETQLIDVTAQARLLIDCEPQLVDWECLCTSLTQQFPAFPHDQSLIRNASRIVVTSAEPDDPSHVTCEWLDGIVRVELISGEPVRQEGWQLLLNEKRELAALRSTVGKSPYPIWRQSEDGRVVWSNEAYARLVRQFRSGDDCEPIFQTLAEPSGETRTKRLPVTGQDGTARRWFDVTVTQADSEWLCYANDVDEVVAAENAQRQFVQTLAKTFAQLSIGLAIFDRNRQLALFNPALVDLTALPADFLSARPNILSFFDRLRNQNMMPEPKNYNSWRHQMAELVAAASDGRYHETWSLPSGSVYSVSGRPHPDGAIAFLFEDITAEITLTRRFRSDLEMGQSILDRLDQAIAVFAADGSLTFTNSAFRELWSVDPDKSFAQMTVIDATRSWQNRCKATPVWGEIRDFVASRENRADWSAQVSLANGARVKCNVMPLHKGATMVTFQPAESLPARRQEAAAVQAGG